MKKKAFVLLTGVILIASLVAVAGCGSGNSADKAKAKEFMEEGDKHISEFESNSGNMKGQPPADSGINRDLSDEEIEELRSEMEAALETSKEDFEKAKTSYGKILSLDDAEDYKEYAEVMLEIVVAYEDGLELMISGFEEGDGPPESLPSRMEEMASTMDTTRDDIEKLKSEAEKIKEEKNL